MKKELIFTFPQAFPKNFSNAAKRLCKRFFQILSTAVIFFITCIFHHFSTGVENYVDKKFLIPFRRKVLLFKKLVRCGAKLHDLFSRRRREPLAPFVRASREKTLGRCPNPYPLLKKAGEKVQVIDLLNSLISTA